jgi:hypothetical protein
MSAVVVKTGEVSCGHPPGVLSVQSSQTVLTIDGKPVLLLDDIAKVSASSGCTNPASNLPACKKVSVLATGGSRVLKVNGEAVALANVTGTTDQAGSIRVSKPGQTRLTET